MPLTKEQQEALDKYALNEREVGRLSGEVYLLEAELTAQIAKNAQIEKKLDTSRLQRDAALSSSQVLKDQVEEALGVRLNSAYRSVDSDARYSSREG